MTHPLPPLVAERLRALRERPAEPTDKGFGYPVLTLRESALAGNLAAMAAYCAGAGVELAPHGKTAMSPELAARQLASGAWGITVATIGQLRMYRAFGFPRLLLANELVDEPGIAWLAGELAADPGFAAYCYVDSTDGVAILDRVLTAHPAGRRLPVLVEIGLGRTGCRTDDQALTVAKAAAATSTLTVAGRGRLRGHDRRPPRAGPRHGRVVLPSAGEPGRHRGGSSRGPRRVHRHGRRKRVLRRGGPRADRGCPGGDDRGPAQRLLPLPRSRHLPGRPPAARGVAGAPVFRPALELWAQVVSRPEPELALLSAGRRDAGFDAGLPVPLRARRRDGGAAGWPTPK